MITVNVTRAKATLSRLVEALESGAEHEIIISRNGKPAAKLVAVTASTDARKRIGLLEGRFTAPDDFDADNEEIAALMLGRQSRDVR